MWHGLIWAKPVLQHWMWLCPAALYSRTASPQAVTQQLQAPFVTKASFLPLRVTWHVYLGPRRSILGRQNCFVSMTERRTPFMSESGTISRGMLSALSVARPSFQGHEVKTQLLVHTLQMTGGSVVKLCGRGGWNSSHTLTAQHLSSCERPCACVCVCVRL